MCKKKASITIFTLLTILMIAAVLFALIEGTRYVAINKVSTEYVNTAVESAFSYYVKPLWEDYGILGIDLGFGNDAADISKLDSRVNQLLEKNAALSSDSGRINLIGLSQAVAKASTYNLLTDDGGAGLIKEAADTETISALADILNQEGVDLSYSELDLDTILQSGEDAIASGSSGSEEVAADTADIEPIKVEKSPIEEVMAWKDQTILSQVLDTDTVSTAVIETAALVSHRQISEGTGNTAAASVTDKLLFRKYLIDRFQSYANDLKHEGMSYELEYVLSGKESDRANLESCVVKLLSVREVENFIAILTDKAKTETAYAIALGLAGETLSPAAIEVVKYAVIAAWAYVESVLDVRLLLAGGKVSMVKSADEWTSDLTQLAMYLDTKVKARECTGGLSYADYIYQILILTDDRTLAFRAMDVMENHIRKEENYTEFKIDNALYKATYIANCEVKPLFLSLAGIHAEGYSFTRETTMSYE